MVVAVVASAVFVAQPAHAALGLRDQADPQPWMTNGIVYASAVSENGETLYIGGKFSSVREKPAGSGGQTLAVTNVAAIDVDTGAPVRTWKPSVAGETGAPPVVRALAAKDGRVYIGGKFASVGGQPRRNLAAVSDAASATPGALVGSFAPNIGNNTSTVYTLLPNGDATTPATKLYVGGQFGSVNGVNRGHLAALNLPSGSLDTAWVGRANKLVRELEFGPNNDGTIFAVGGFETVSSGTSGNISRQSVARFDTATSAVHPWAVPPGEIITDSGRNNTMTCWDATVTPTLLYVNCGLGPNFTSAHRLDNGDTGNRVWIRGFGGNPQTSEMSPDGSRLIVGGHFGINPIKEQYCGKPLGGLIALNPATGAVDCPWVPHLDQNKDPSYDGAWTMQVIGDYVWVGGGFVGVSGEPRSNLARWTYDPALKSVNAPPRVDLDGPPQPASGPQRGGLDATYYDNQDFTGAQVTRTDPTVNFDWGGGSPDPSIGPDQFSARWTGQVEAPVSGEYTFTTTSDDGVRLFIDGQQVVDNWTNHGPTDDSGTITLQAGQRYDVRIDFFEDAGGATLRFQWAYPGQARQAVPSNSLFYTSSSTGGLDATYYDNQDFTGAQVTRTDPTVNFDWGDGSPDPAIGPNNFSARWTGQVEAPVSGEYTFTTTADDGIRLFIDSGSGNKLIIDNWTDRAPTDDSGTVTLEAGQRYDIELDYYENGGGAVARLQWAYPGQARQVIPANRLFNGGNVNYSAPFTPGAGPTPIVSNALTVSDADDANLKLAKVTLAGNLDAPSERLSANVSGTAITANFDAQSGVLNLAGTAPKADYQQVLRTVTYNNTCANPTGGDRAATFVVNDGSVDSRSATSTITVQANNPPGGDCSGLSVQAPSHRLPAAGSTLTTTTVPVNLSWSATASGTGSVASYELQRSTNDGAYQDVSLGADPTRTNLNVSLAPGSAYRFRVRATDNSGNVSGWAEGSRFVLDAPQQSSATLAYSGSWAEQAVTSAFGGSTMHASQAGSAATLTFTGTDVSWVAQKGTDRGKAEVRLDGTLVETIDLYASAAQPRRVIYNATSLDPSVEHTLEVRVLGTKRAASTSTRVDVDAFVVIR